MKMNKKKITLTLPVELIDLLKTYSRKQDLSSSVVVQMMLKKAFSKEKAG